MNRWCVYKGYGVWSCVRGLGYICSSGKCIELEDGVYSCMNMRVEMCDSFSSDFHMCHIDGQ